MLLLVYWPALAFATHYPKIPSLKRLDIFRVDKLIHYTLFSLLTYLVLRSGITERRNRFYFNLFVGGLLAGVYSVADEWTQQYCGRDTNLRDAITNLTAVAGMCCAWGLSHSRWRGETVRIRVARVSLLIVSPYLAIMAFTPGLQWEVVKFVLLLHKLRLQMTMDKAAHFVLSILLATMLYASAPFGRGRRLLNMTVVVAVSSLASPAVEYLQLYFHREFDRGDILAHELGLATMIVVWGMNKIILWWVDRAWRHRRHPCKGADTAAVAAGDAQATTAQAAEAVMQDGVAARKEPVHGGGFVGHALTVSVLTFLSRLTGLARDSFLVGVWGLSGVSDAFWFGFSIPNLLRRLFGEGALTAAMIPVYTDLKKNDAEGARRFASLCMAMTLVVLGGLTLVGESILAGVLFSREWSNDSSLAIRLTMVMLPYMPMVCLVAVFGGVLQVHGRFAPSAGMPILLNIVMIVGGWFVISRGQDVNSLRTGAYIISICVLVAGVVQLVSQWWMLRRHFSLTTTFAGSAGAFWTFWKAFTPTLIALSVFQINTFMDQMIAMGLSPKDGGGGSLHLFGKSIAFPIESGGLAALNCAQRLYQFPLGVFGLAIATAIFPALSSAATDDGGVRSWNGRFLSTLRHGMRLTVFIGLPASAGLMLVGLPLSRVLFERGRFTLDDSKQVALILMGYAPAIWAYSMSHVLTRGFYAMKDARTPLRISVAMVGLNLVLNLSLVWGLGAAGLAWATAICAVLQCTSMVRCIGKEAENPIDRKVFGSWAKTAFLTLLIVLALWPILVVYDPAGLTHRQCLVELAVMILLGMGIFLAGAWVLECEEIEWLLKKGRGPTEMKGKAELCS